jgi:hypothetical protein
MRPASPEASERWRALGDLPTVELCRRELFAPSATPGRIPLNGEHRTTPIPLFESNDDRQGPPACAIN